MKCFERYTKTINQASLLSKISSFLIAVLVFIEMLYLLDISFNNQNRFYAFFSEYLTGLLFLSIISFTFTTRFILLWFKSAKYIWLSQFLWLFGWLSIIAYKLVTAKFLFGSFWGTSFEGCIDCFYFDTFLFASNTLVVILLAYLVISPIKQLSIFIYSFFTKE